MDYFIRERDNERKREYRWKINLLKKIYIPSLKVFIDDNWPNSELEDISIRSLEKIRKILYNNLEYADEQTEELYWNLSEFLFQSYQYNDLEKIELSEKFKDRIIVKYDELMKYFRKYYKMKD